VPALPAAGNVVRVALSGSISQAGPWLTRFFVHFSGSAPSPAQLATFDTAVIAAYNTDIKPLVDSNTELLQVESIDLTSSTGAVDITAASIIGTRSGASLNASDCVVASYEIARRYRGGHPRGYWKLGTQTDLFDPGHYSPTAVALFTTGLNAFFTAVFGSGWSGAGSLTHVSVSYYDGNTVVISPTTGRARNVPVLRVSPIIDPVTALEVRNQIGSQRRREQFIG
jgi:hypothetical protein